MSSVIYYVKEDISILIVKLFANKRTKMRAMEFYSVWSGILKKNSRLEELLMCSETTDSSP